MKLSFLDIFLLFSVLYFSRILCGSGEKVLLDLSESDASRSQVDEFASIISESLEEVNNRLMEDEVVKISYEIKPPRNANSSLNRILMKTLKETIAKVAPSLEYTITSGFVSEMNEDDHEIKLLEYNVNFTRNQNANRKLIFKIDTNRLDNEKGIIQFMDSLYSVLGKHSGANTMTLRLPPNADKLFASKVRQALNQLWQRKQKESNGKKLKTTPSFYYRYTPEHKVKEIVTSLKTTEIQGNKGKSHKPVSTETYQYVYENTPEKSESMELIDEEKPIIYNFSFQPEAKEIEPNPPETQDEMISAKSSRPYRRSSNDHRYSSGQQETTRENRPLDDEYSSLQQEFYPDEELQVKANQYSSYEQETTQDVELPEKENHPLDYQYSSSQQDSSPDKELQEEANPSLYDQYSSSAQEISQDEKLPARKIYPINDQNSKPQQKTTRDERLQAISNRPLNDQYSSNEQEATQNEKLVKSNRPGNYQYWNRHQKTTRGEKLPTKRRRNHPVDDQYSKNQHKTARDGRISPRSNRPSDDQYPSDQDDTTQDSKFAARGKHLVDNQNPKRQQKTTKGGKLPSRSNRPLDDQYLSGQQETIEDESLPTRSNQPIDDQNSKRQQKTSRGGRLPARANHPFVDQYSKHPRERLLAKYYRQFSYQNSRDQTKGGKLSSRANNTIDRKKDNLTTDRISKSELKSTQGDNISRESNLTPDDQKSEEENKTIRDEERSDGSNFQFSDESLESELQSAQDEEQVDSNSSLENQDSNGVRKKTPDDYISTESIPPYSDQISESDLETTQGEKLSAVSDPPLDHRDSKNKIKRFQGDNISMEPNSGDLKDELKSSQVVGKSAGPKSPFDHNSYNELESTQGDMPIATPNSIFEDQKSNGVIVTTQGDRSSVTDISSSEDQNSEESLNSYATSSIPIQLSNSNSSLKEPIIAELQRQMKECKKKGLNSFLLTFNIKKRTLTNTEMDQIVEDIYLEMEDLEPECHIHPAHFKLSSDTEISIEVLVDMPPEKEMFEMLGRFPNVKNNSVELLYKKGIDLDYLYSRIDEILEYKLFMARIVNSGQRIFLDLPFELRGKIGKKSKKFFVILLHEITQYLNSISGVKFVNHNVINIDKNLKLLVVKISMKYSHEQAHEGLAAVPEIQGKKKRWNKDLGWIWTIF